MTIIYLISCSVFLAFILTMLVTSANRLPEGYEDETGFHYGTRTKRSRDAR